jgi:hypothetical protein
MMMTLTSTIKGSPGRERRAKNQKGSFMVEFAIVGWTLFFLMAGVLQLGLNMSRAMTAAAVCRDANVLTVRGIDLSQTANQQLIGRAASGLGLSASGSWTPSSSGTAAVYISKVMLVGPLECANGVANFDGTSSTCPNLNKYVIAMRIGMGNTSRWTSAVGTPASTPQSNGTLTDSQICTVAGNITTAFPADLSLTADEYTWVSEVFADTSNINFFTFLTPSAIYMRNLS